MLSSYKLLVHLSHLSGGQFRGVKVLYLTTKQTIIMGMSGLCNAVVFNTSHVSRT